MVLKNTFYKNCLSPYFSSSRLDDAALKGGGHSFGAARDAELLEEDCVVGENRTFAELSQPGNLAVGKALGQQAQHIELTAR